MNSALIHPNDAILHIHANRPKLFTEKRFVYTKNLSQAEWLEGRRQGSGSSNCAVACGLNPYRKTTVEISFFKLVILLVAISLFPI